MLATLRIGGLSDSEVGMENHKKSVMQIKFSNFQGTRIPDRTKHKIKTNYLTDYIYICFT